MSSEKKDQDKLELIAQMSFANYAEMYKVVDFLNRTLKEKQVIFGLRKDKNGNMIISIYET